MRRSLFAGMVLALAAVLGAGAARAADSAVVLAYFRFADERFPTANIRLDQLDAHIAELKGGGYAVLPLPAVVDALIRGRPLPDKAVAITIDDAWRSVWDHAWPRLKAAGLPFTVFVVTDEIDRGGAEYMSWDQLRELARSGLVTIASQGAGHPHLPALSAASIADDLARAHARFIAELNAAPDLFAWPYGEMSREAAALVRDAGYRAAFGQHSGPAWNRSDRWFLPRFALNETYGEIERFRLVVRTLPLPAVDVTPADPKLGANPPHFGFTLAEEVPGLEHLACFASHEGRALTERLGPRVEVRVLTPFPQGRGRINCTAPSLDGRRRWFGWQFYVP
ncbi:polysaccharide deacetylase family protein, partial [Magnetospirillum sp. UT-4]|uniref:polysaccharide deacetylase family protein n=1 Tax=Magnetospirillum sp. UT-4 TaxID=2681467 RepID=UPI0015729537